MNGSEISPQPVQQIVFKKRPTSQLHHCTVEEQEGEADEVGRASVIAISAPSSRPRSGAMASARKTMQILKKYVTFIGPGFIIAVSYIDPGNYATDVAAGSSFEYKMLFVLLLTNGFAIVLQALSSKLGIVTGRTLPELCRARFPFWINIFLYLVFEIAIIATDLAEVIGTAVALEILFHIPLVAGVAVTIVDVLIVMLAWKPDGGMRATRYFEIGIALLVGMVVCCFIALLIKTEGISAGDVLKGYLPNKTAFSSSGIYTSLSIMGAVVMPHSLILGTALSQSRLREHDPALKDSTSNLGETEDGQQSYTPTIEAIRSTLKYSIAEQSISLMTFALFVNSAILIVAGAALYGKEEAADADLFSVHDLLSSAISPAAGVIFGIALLASGQSAGIVTTMAGQIVSEGFFNWSIRPWLRRLITRSIAILPCILVAGLVGRSGIAQVLNASQVALSILLPFIAFPIVLFTCDANMMRVPLSAGRSWTSLTTSAEPVDNRHSSDQTIISPFTQGSPDADRAVEIPSVEMHNSRTVSALAWLIWATITGLNTYLIVILAKTHGTGV